MRRDVRSEVTWLTAACALVQLWAWSNDRAESMMFRMCLPGMSVDGSLPAAYFGAADSDFSLPLRPILWHSWLLIQSPLRLIAAARLHASSLLLPKLFRAPCSTMSVELSHGDG